MSIRNKLIAAFAVLSLLLFSLALISQFYLTHSRNAHEETIEDTDQRYDVTKLQYALAGISNDERGYLLLGEEEYVEQIAAKKEQVDALLASIQARDAVDHAYESTVNNIAKLYAAYLSLSDQAIAAFAGGDKDEAHAIHFDMERTARKQLDEEVATLADNLNAEIAGDQKQREKEDGEQEMLMYGFFVAGLLLSVAIGFLVIRAITKPLRGMNAQMREIADGRGDLSREIVVRSKDEIAELAGNFNRMLRNLRGILNQAQDTAIQVASSSEELTASAEQTTRATEQIVEATNRIADSSTNEQHNVAEAVSAVQRMSDGIYDVSSGNDEISRLAQAASAASAEGARSVRAVLTDMQALDETVQQAAVVIQSLGDRSQEVQGIAGMITDLAYRTNLLSLNAGIEASRAGEHGRGFTVVAQEIRKLAEESRRSAEQIGELIQAIVADTAHAVGAMHAGTEKVAQSLSRTDEVDRALHAIDEHVGAVAARVGQTAMTTHQLAASSKQVVALMEEVAEAGNDVAAACQNNSATTEEQLATMEEISSSAQSLSKLAEDLHGVLSRFKLH